MKKRIGKVAFRVIVALAFLFLIAVILEVAFGVPISGTIEERLGSFTGPIGGTAQDDNIKASLDLAHTDLDTGLADNEDLRALLGLGTGNIFYVDSAIGGSTGVSRATAVATIDAAVNLCTTNNGDNILVCEGHSEALTAADGVDVDLHGITIVGLGNGIQRGLLDYTNANGEFVIAGDNVTIRNLAFKANVTDVAHAIDVETGATNFVIDNCWFYVETTGTDEFTDAITTAANSDNGKITNCRVEMGAGGADAFIQNVGCDYVEISNNIVSGDFATACIEDKTTASIWMIIDDNILVNGTVGGTAGLNTVACISLKADTTAIITDNKLFCNVADPSLAIVAADGFLAGNTYCNAEGTYTGSQPVAGYGKINSLIAQSSAMTAGNGYTAAGDPVLFTVTGDVMVRCFAIVDTSVTSTSNDTVELGVTGDTACVLVQDVVDGTALVANDVWTLTQAGDTPSAEWDGEWVIIPNGLDIKMSINDHDLTAGVITYYMQWIALSPDGNVQDSVD